MNCCKWGMIGCLNMDRCYLCTSEGLHYKSKNAPKKSLSHRQAKVTKRKGAQFEYDNNQANKNMLSGATSRMTPNSGAGKVKGDEEIRGIITIMEELKEQNKTTAKGEKQFSIQKDWLMKLRREATEAGKEFWYLKFIFATNENDIFVVSDYDVFMSMVYTMVSDRQSKMKAINQLDVIEKLRRLTDAENTKLLAEIDYLKAQLKAKEEPKL